MTLMYYREHDLRPLSHKGKIGLNIVLDNLILKLKSGKIRTRCVECKQKLINHLYCPDCEKLIHGRSYRWQKGRHSIYCQICASIRKKTA